MFSKEKRNQVCSYVSPRDTEEGTQSPQISQTDSTFLRNQKLSRNGTEKMLFLENCQDHERHVHKYIYGKYAVPS
jgi:hypothetical protein